MPQVRVDAPAGEDHLQGDRRDDQDRGQERGLEDLLLRVQGGQSVRSVMYPVVLQKVPSEGS